MSSKSSKLHIIISTIRNMNICHIMIQLVQEQDDRLLNNTYMCVVTLYWWIIISRGSVLFSWDKPVDFVSAGEEVKSFSRQTIALGDEPDPGCLATGTKFGEQFSCLYVDRHMSID